MACWVGFQILAKEYTKQNAKRRIFVGAEGKSEITLTAWLQQICDDAGLALHLDQFNARGGDAVAIVRKCKGRIRTSSNRLGKYDHRVILLDSDRLENDIGKGRDPTLYAEEENINLIYLEPNIEGFYFRLHKGNEEKILEANKTVKELKKIWPEYGKNLPSIDLIDKFTVEDIKRVAQFDKNIEKLLLILGLLKKSQIDNTTSQD